MNNGDEGKSSRMNPILAGAGQYWGQRAKHQAAPEVFFTPPINRIKLAKIYSIYISILKFYSVVYICDYIRKPANAGELNELLLMFMIMNCSDSGIN